MIPASMAAPVLHNTLTCLASDRQDHELRKAIEELDNDQKTITVGTFVPLLI